MTHRVNLPTAGCGKLFPIFPNSGQSFFQQNLDMKPFKFDFNRFVARAQQRRRSLKRRPTRDSRNPGSYLGKTIDCLEERTLLSAFRLNGTALDLDLDKAGTNLSIRATGEARTQTTHTDVTRPGDSTQGSSTDNSSVFRPEEAFDDSLTTSAGTFLDVPGQHFVVTPQPGSPAVNGLRGSTNRHESRNDPGSYRLEGGDSSSGPWTLISEGSLSLPTERSTRGPLVSFANTTAYNSYRLRFPTRRDGEGSFGTILVSEVELIHSATQTVTSDRTLVLKLNNGDKWTGTDNDRVRGNGTDTLTVTPTGVASITGAKVTDSTVGTSVSFADSGGSKYSSSFDVQLNNLNAGTIEFAGNTSFTGTASLSAETGQNIVVSRGASVSTVDGSLTLIANQQTAPTNGNFHGVLVDGVVEATGKGTVTLRGQAGAAATSNFLAGVLVAANGRVVGGPEGTLRIDGTGTSRGVGDAFNFFQPQFAMYGVHLAAGEITSRGAKVEVSGQGGFNNAAKIGLNNFGVRVDGGGRITAGGNGAVDVRGVGGVTGVTSAGVSVAGSTSVITSSGGNVQVTGTGGGAGTGGSGAGANGYGVLVQEGMITAGGSGTITVSGRGGTSTFADNDGVRVASNGKITSSKETVAVVGTAGTNTGLGIVIDATISQTATTGASGIVLLADTIDITSNGVVDTTARGTQTTPHGVAIYPQTSTVGIDVGGADVRGTNGKLGLTDAELNRIFTNGLRIGSFETGPINVSTSVSIDSRTSVVSLLSQSTITDANRITASKLLTHANRQFSSQSDSRTILSRIRFTTSGQFSSTSTETFSTSDPVLYSVAATRPDGSLVYVPALVLMGGINVDRHARPERVATNGKVFGFAGSELVELSGGLPSNRNDLLFSPTSFGLNSNLQPRFSIPGGQGNSYRIEGFHIQRPEPTDASVTIKLDGTLFVNAIGGVGFGTSAELKSSGFVVGSSGGNFSSVGIASDVNARNQGTPVTLSLGGSLLQFSAANVRNGNENTRSGSRATLQFEGG